MSREVGGECDQRREKRQAERRRGRIRWEGKKGVGKEGGRERRGGR